MESVDLTVLPRVIAGVKVFVTVNLEPVAQR
jgi:hypothetical protein